MTEEKKHLYNLILRTKKHWKYLIARSFGAVISSTLTIVGAYVWGRTVDIAIGGSIDEFYVFIGVVGLFVIVRSVLNYFNPLISLKYYSSSMNDIREFYMSKILRFPVSFFDEHHTGDIISRLNSSLNVIEDFLDNRITNFIYIPTQLLVGITYLATINWKLLLISLVVVPPITFTARHISKKLTKQSKRIQKTISAVNTYFRDMINGIYVFKAFNLPAIFDKKVNAAVSDNVDANKDYEKRNSMLIPLEVLSGYMPRLICFIVGGIFALRGEITAGELVIFINAMRFILGGISSIPGQLAATRKASGAAEHLAEMIECEDEPSGALTIDKTAPDPIIRFSDVIFSYKSDLTLNGIDFSINKNETTAIVGQSGSGKTTIFSLLCGFYSVQAGKVEVYGQDIRALDTNSLRKAIALVSQDTYLYNVTILENIRFGNVKASDSDVLEVAKKAFAHDFIIEQPDGYNTLVGEKGVTLSGGQKQRISIARAILNDSDIILFDEATSSLDPESKKYIQKAMQVLIEEKTVIIVTHDLSAIINADKILVIEEGMIIEQGTHDQLKENEGLYERLLTGILTGGDE